MVQSYPWYAIVDGSASLAQGDLIDRCPIVVPPATLSPQKGAEGAIEIRLYNVVVMSQSCDLEHHKVEFVLVCAVHPLELLGKQNGWYASRNGREELRRGNAIGYHLLNRCDLEGLRKDFQVVSFRDVHSVHVDLLRTTASSSSRRLRLLPPYREHLSQAFARCFMRVALPDDLLSFD